MVAECPCNKLLIIGLLLVPNLKRERTQKKERFGLGIRKTQGEKGIRALSAAFLSSLLLRKWIIIMLPTN